MAEVRQILILALEYKELMRDGMTYEQLLDMLNYDKEVYETKKAAKTLLDNGKTQLDVVTLYQTENQNSVINSRESFGVHKTAMQLAAESMFAQENECMQLALKNTNLD